jgi:hypothetical protein
MISTANNRKEQQMRNKHHINNDYYEVINDRKVLKDGRRYHAGSVLLMDSATPRHPGFPRVKTADGNDLSFHKPGWRLAATHDADPPEFSYGVTAADRQAIIDARQQYEGGTSVTRKPGRCIARPLSPVPSCTRARCAGARSCNKSLSSRYLRFIACFYFVYRSSQRHADYCAHSSSTALFDLGALGHGLVVLYCSRASASASLSFNFRKAT